MPTKIPTENALPSLGLSPLTTPYLLGHGGAETEFFKAFKNGKLHHSWLITGQKGIGKATLAYRIARYIFTLSNQDLLKNIALDTNITLSELQNISSDITNDFDDDTNDEDDYTSYEPSETTFSSTMAITKTTSALSELDNSPLKISPKHPIFERLIAGGITDLMIIEREYTDASRTKLKSEISVEQIRTLKDFFSKTSSEGNYKIAIIDSVDEMNPNSSNALLKILEEAPNKSLLLLVCNNSEGLLDTIKSRCRILKLFPLSDTNMSLLINEYIPAISKEDTMRLISLSEGSIGTALNFYNNGGLELLQLFYSIIPEILKGKNKNIMELVSNIGTSEIKLNIFKEIFTKFLNNIIKIHSKVNVNFSSQDEEKITIFCAKYFTNISKLFNVLDQSLTDFELTPLLNLDYTAVIMSIFERLKNAY